MEGKLLSHGAARYQFQPTETPSYYARLLTPGGLVTLWGRGLAKAITQSTTHVCTGDRVAFRRLDQDPQTGRVQWRAEKPEWFVAHDKEASSPDEKVGLREAEGSLRVHYVRTAPAARAKPAVEPKRTCSACCPGGTIVTQLQDYDANALKKNFGALL